MKHQKELLLTRDLMPQFITLTAAYTIIEGVLAFLLVTGMGRTYADGFVDGDGWGALGMLAVAAVCAWHDTRVNGGRYV